MNRPLQEVKSNKKGSHGIDGMTVDELLQFLKENGEQIRQCIREKYLQAKTCAADKDTKARRRQKTTWHTNSSRRVVQQAIAQVLSPIFEKQFSIELWFRPRGRKTGGIEMQGIHRSRLRLGCGY